MHDHILCVVLCCKRHGAGIQQRALGGAHYLTVFCISFEGKVFLLFVRYERATSIGSYKGTAFKEKEAKYVIDLPSRAFRLVDM